MHDRLLMYDSLRCCFVSIKKPPKSKTCATCSDSPSIKSMADSKAVSLAFRGPAGSGVEGGKGIPRRPPISDELSISCADYNELRQKRVPHILLDVREKLQFDLCSLSGAINIPLVQLRSQWIQLSAAFDVTLPIFCICRRGVFSVEATKVIADANKESSRVYSVRNITGGLAAWTEEVDPSFPKY